MFRTHCLLSVALALAIVAAPSSAQEGSKVRDLKGKLKSAARKIEAAAESAIQPSPGQTPRTKAPKVVGRLRGGAAQNAHDHSSTQPTSTDSNNPAASNDHGSVDILAVLGVVEPADVSSSGRFLVASNPNGGLIVCDSKTRRQLRQLQNSRQAYTLVKMSADARWIAAVRRDQPDQIDLWRADNGRLVRTIAAGTGAKRSLEFSPGGDELRVLSDSGQGTVYSIPGGLATGGFSTANGGSLRRGPRAQIAPPITPRTGAGAAPGGPTFGARPPMQAPVEDSEEGLGTDEFRSRSLAAPSAPAASAPSIAPKSDTARPRMGGPRIAAPAAPPAVEPSLPAPPTDDGPDFEAPSASDPGPSFEPETSARDDGPALDSPDVGSAPPQFQFRSEPSSAAPEDVPFAPESSAPAAAAPAPSARMMRSAPAPQGIAPEMAVPRSEMPDFAAPEAATPAEAPPSDAIIAPEATAPEAPEAAAPESAMEAIEDFSTEESAPAEPAPRSFAIESEPEPAPDARLAAPAPAVSVVQPPDPADLSSVTVHYATNRNRLSAGEREWLTYFKNFFGSLPAFVVYVLVLVAVIVFPWMGKRSWATAAMICGALALCAMGTLEAYVRSQLRDELSGEVFGARASDLSYGTCKVSVPKPENRQAGELNRPLSVWILEAPENPEKHFTLQKLTEHEDQDEFYKSLSNQLAKSSDGVSLLFIHGYNVSFEDAIFRTAQLAVDLKFHGAPITFSWPSYADPLKYTFDEQNAEVSIPALREVLEGLAVRSGAKRIHIIAHSMGNRVLAGALRSMPAESRPINKEMFREVVLAAPDIDSRVFTSQILPHIHENAQHCTLYASNRDRALMMSRYFHNFQRLGETQPELIVATGMDTIDASLVDTSLLGHSYIGDVQSIVSDLRDLVVRGMRPKERLGLETLLLGNMMYWTIKPMTQTASEDGEVRR